MEENPAGLKITLNDEGKEKVKDLKESHPDWNDLQIWGELFDDVQGNSEYIFHHDIGESGFGLTSAEGITDGYHMSDEGKGYETDYPESAKVYWFPNYMVESSLETLINDGSVVFTEAKETDGILADGGKAEETVYIEYLNKKKNFKQDKKTFKGKDAYKKAVEWGKKNLGNFHLDMIGYEFADGGKIPLPEKGTPEWHKVQIAYKTIKMPSAMQGVMGGMTEDEAWEVLNRYGFKKPVYIFDISNVKSFVEKLNTQLKAPYVNAYYSTLGGDENVSVLLTISLDEKSKWANGILENSRYGKFHIYKNGTIEHFSGFKMLKFRKAKAKSQDDVIDKLNKHIEKQPTMQDGGEVPEKLKKFCDLFQKALHEPNLRVEYAYETATDYVFNLSGGKYTMNRVEGKLKTRDFKVEKTGDSERRILSIPKDARIITSLQEGGNTNWFVDEETGEIGVDAPKSTIKRYIYSYHEERGELSASVRDIDDNYVWQFNHPDYSLDPEEREMQSTPVDDGFMKHWDDVAGLEKHLKSLEIIPQDSELITEAEYERKYMQSGGVAVSDYSLLGYIVTEEENIFGVQPDEINKYKESQIESIVYELPKEIDPYSKYVYKINNNQFYNSLTKVTDLDGEIAYYEERLSEKESPIYEAVPVIRPQHEAYLKMLKFKKENPKAIFGQAYHWKKADGGVASNNETILFVLNTKKPNKGHFASDLKKIGFDFMGAKTDHSPYVFRTENYELYRNNFLDPRFYVLPIKKQQND
jgi:hypothetical protein